MTIYEVADLLLKARGRIDVYWNVYIAIVVATIGWLLSHRHALARPIKALVTVVYAIAAGMNLMGLYTAYTFAEALRDDLLRMANGAPLPATLALLERYSYVAHRHAAIWIHLVVGGTVLAAVWFARGPRGGDRSPAD
jgi:hypothetical protein